MSKHHRSGRGRGAVALLALLFTGACTTEPDVLDEQMIEDVALMAADATLEDLALWSQPFGTAPTTVDGEGQAAPGTPGGHLGFFGTFSGTRSVTFYDEDGNEQAGYDPLLTASIEIVHEIEGEVSREGWSASVYRLREMAVSGLLGEETHRTWDGTGSSEVSHSRHLDDGTERSYEAIGSVEYEEVVVPIPGSDPRYPVSGTIRRSMTVTRSGPDGDVTRTVEVVITFDGSSTATATVNGEEMEIDLSAGIGINPIRRHRRG